MRSPRKTPPTPRVSAMVWRSPKPRRHLEVGDGRGVPADVDRVDDEVGAGQRGATVGLGPHRRLAAVALDGDPGHALGQLEPARVDVVHHERERTEVVVGRAGRAASWRVNSADPAPTKQTVVMRASMALTGETSKTEQSCDCFWTDAPRSVTIGTVSMPEPAVAARRVLVVGDANPDLVLRGDVVPRFGQAEQLLDAADAGHRRLGRRSPRTAWPGSAARSRCSPRWATTSSARVTVDSPAAGVDVRPDRWSAADVARPG